MEVDQVVDMVVALVVDGFKLRKVCFKFCCLLEIDFVSDYFIYRVTVPIR